MGYKVFDIADKIIAVSLSQAEVGDVMTNLKLQKLLYYMQGFHLAVFDTPLFDEDIEAWQYGPVVPLVYHKYKDNGAGAITSENEPISLNNDEERLFNQVYKIYGDFSAVGLMNLTHAERPWKETPVGVGNVISHDLMKEFFKTRVRK